METTRNWTSEPTSVPPMIVAVLLAKVNYSIVGQNTNNNNDNNNNKCIYDADPSPHSFY